MNQHVYIQAYDKGFLSVGPNWRKVFWDDEEAKMDAEAKMEAEGYKLVDGCWDHIITGDWAAVFKKGA